MANESQNNWSEYSKLVITELERLNDGITKLNDEMQYLKREIAELKIKEDNVKELKRWKDTMDDVTSPSQLKETIKDVTELKTFKAQAITVWVVVQIIFGILITILQLMK
jgi:TolA-binding protein